MKTLMVILILLYVNLIYSETADKQKYKVVQVEENFNSDYDLVVFTSNDSLFHTLIEKKELGDFTVADVFVKDSMYVLDIDFKESLFANHPLIISSNLDSLRENTYRATYTLENIKNSEIIVYEIKNLDLIIRNR
jgi:hypothetical protein